MGKDNNFNLLRLMAALAVVISHSFSIVTGDVNADPLRTALGVSLGSLAVDFFFACSGFLVCASYYNRASVTLFLRARALRIFPALLVMLVITLVFVGSIVTTESAKNFYFSSQTIAYFFKNLVLLLGVEYELPGVFLTNPYPKAVNGSLWTLPLELRSYLVLLFLGWFTVRYCSFTLTRCLFTFLSVFILSLEITALFFDATLPHYNFVHLQGIFLLGATLYLYRFHEKSWLVLATISSLFVLFVAAYTGNFKYVSGFTLPVVALGLAYTRIHFLDGYSRLGDYSYGVYVYAFPVQQSLIFFLPDISVMQMMVFASLISFAFAALSWHFVEKPSLELK